MTDPVKISGGEALDLHNFNHRDVPTLVDEFVWLCLKEGRDCGEIIHGKGKGTLRDLVHSCLSKNSAVETHSLGSVGEMENWGKTTFRLRGPKE